MRLWSLHPRYLDRQGLVAGWREGLLAQAVLLGRTKGYTSHPQLERFRSCEDPPAAIGAFLTAIAIEAAARGYKFDSTKINRHDGNTRLTVTDGQLDFERRHLLAKVKARNPEDTARIALLSSQSSDAHPMFDVIPGAVETWERGSLPPDQ